MYILQITLPFPKPENHCTIVKMKIRIHRGSNEIGASCFEIQGQKARILIDAGHPLDDSESSLPQNINLYDAVFISHCHQDHYGLLENMPSNVPVYMGAVAWDFVCANRLFMNKEALSLNLKPLAAWEPVTIGDLEIKPYLVDHSAPEAFSFLVDSGDKKLYYSGDFRAHGRKSKLFDNMCKRPPENIDALVMEGTMVNRSNTKYPNEDSVENGMIETINMSEGITCLISSSQNIDRLVSAYRAARNTKKIFVVDIYTAWILEKMRESGRSTPSIEWDDVKVLAKNWPGSKYYNVIKNNPDIFRKFTQKIYSDDIVIDLDCLQKEPNKYFMKMTPKYILRYANEHSTRPITVIYSMWEGYLAERTGTKGHLVYEKLRSKPMVKFEKIHTSGHATLDDLKTFASAINPKVIIPFHSEHKTQYPEHFENVKMLDDGELYTL